ncbi:cytosine/adenosine deaminase-related metal-dependent hydrolase [Chitinophaga skermanii]|uniref:Cytosine/adenosine deaminase-related metal-dependent hydrolase n=1 Tax=Chitinophaga skermanii TaxID=331697 RepID=A0A327QIW6_9BACT|nr:amidohydrolase family protein [Chitinophaga skermanii]RAJ03935.1 cytosine/adenosine deaminase-related metal-dependent hydrolase [Chitinophaga skermanii]
MKLLGEDIFDGNRFLGPGKVLITATDGTIEGIVNKSEAGENVQEIPGILCPGFINTHCHIELSHMKGVIPEKTGLPAFLRGVMTQRGNDPIQQHDAMVKAVEDMREAGIVAVGDISNTDTSAVIKSQQALYYHTFVESTGFIEAFANQRFQGAQVVYQAFRDAGLPATIVPHAPYSVSGALFQQIAGFEQQGPLSIHNQECPAEDQLYASKSGEFLDFFQFFGINIDAFQPTGKSSLQSYLPYFTGRDKMLLVHNTCTHPQDVQFAKSLPLQLFWVLCINANLYIEGKVPPIDMFREMGCTLTLGTDSLASNHTLSIWEEIKSIQQHFPHIDLAEILQWATKNGAEALDIANTYGSFEIGKKPGIIAIHNNNITHIR